MFCNYSDCWCTYSLAMVSCDYSCSIQLFFFALKYSIFLRNMTCCAPLTGVLGGKTVEVAEAQAVLAVCKWRKEVLLKEQKELVHPPPPRFGASITRLGRVRGRRLLYMGGWNLDRAVAKGESMVLNLEQELEKQRRLDDEYKAKLGRERSAHYHPVYLCILYIMRG
jgi:hypothetical protein